MKLLTTLLEIPFNGFKVIEDVNVYHYIKPTNVQAPYAIWQEESDDLFYSDNGKSERTLNGILDYYTKVNAGLDPGLDVLEKAMIAVGMDNKLKTIINTPIYFKATLANSIRSAKVSPGTNE